MEKLKQSAIGSFVYIPMLGKQIEATEENAGSLMAHGMHHLFEDAQPVKAPRKTKVKTVNPDTGDDSANNK